MKKINNKIKKIIITITFLTLTCSSFASGYPVPSADIIVKDTANEKVLAKSINTAQLLSQIKSAIPSLVVFDVKDTQIGNYKEIYSNAGTLFVDGKGNVLMGAKKVMLINYGSNDLSSIDDIKKVIAESTGYKVTDYNKDSGLYYFKAGEVTVITSEDTAKTPYALMGAFTTTSQLQVLKSKVLGAEKSAKVGKEENTQSTENKSKAAKKAPVTAIKKPQISSTDTKSQGILKALNYIEKDYPQNIVKFTTSQSKSKATLTIFTDYTCPHCKELHEHLPQLLKQGYNVNYILMPRAGVNSKVAQNMQQALCAENPQTATAYLYQNGQLPKDLKEQANCQVEMKNNLLFADGFGVVGTPTIISSTGKVSSGFSTVYGMLSKLDLAKD